MRLNRNLSILLSGQLISQVGDKFYLLALSYWVLETTGSATTMGLVLFFTLFPETVMGLVAGAFVDRYNRKWIIVGTDFLRGMVVLGLALLFYMDAMTIGSIIVAQILLSLNTAFFNPCIPAVIPQVVDTEHLSKANAQTQLIRGISTVLGPILGGLSVVAFGYLFVFAFNGISFLMSALFELFLKLPDAVETEHTSGLREDIRDGFRFVIREQNLVVLIGSVAVIHFFVGSFQTIAPVLANQLSGNGIQTLGYLQTAFGIGMVVISLVFGMANLINHKEGLTLFGSVFLIGVVNVVLALLVFFDWNRVWFHLIPFFAYGGALILAVTSFRTLIQKSIPNQMAGRVFGMAFSIGDVSIPLAMLIYGILLDRVSLDRVLLVSGISLIILTVLFLRNTQRWQTVSADSIPT